MSTQDTLSIKPIPLPTSIEHSFMTKHRTAHVLVDPNYRIWDRSVIKWHDGKYHAYYARWQGIHDRWLSDSEIVHAVSDTPEGPFTVTGVVIANRNPGGWDSVDAHSHCSIVIDEQVAIYFQTLDLRGHTPPRNDTGHIHFSDEWLANKDNYRTLVFAQRLGMAVADNPAGPFVRSTHPVITPEDSDLISGITDNPAVAYKDSRYVMVFKSFDATKEGIHRSQFVGHAQTMAGPFSVAEEPVYTEKQTEDATLWYDKILNRYYMVCHVCGESALAMFTSTDGLRWAPAAQPILMKKEFLLEDGSIWKPNYVEQPRVLTDDSGTPIMLYVAVGDGEGGKEGVNGNIAVFLDATR